MFDNLLPVLIFLHLQETRKKRKLRRIVAFLCHSLSNRIGSVILWRVLFVLAGFQRE